MEAQKNISDMFVRIDELNFWGVCQEDQLASLACLKCGTVLTNVNDFIGAGPEHGAHAWFCNTHFQEYKRNFNELYSLCKKEGLNFPDELGKAVKEIKEVEKLLLSGYRDKIARNKQWCFLDGLYLKNIHRL